MTILITGIHGFVGSNLVLALKNNHEIYGLDIVNPEVDGVIRTFAWSEIDTLPAIDIVIHLAGMAHDTKNRTVAQKYFDINTGLTKKIYDWFLQSTAKKFIFFSSVKAAADKVDGILTEDIIPAPIGPYGESKIEAEKYIISRQTTDNRQQTYILRPCMIHGPGNKGNLNLLYNVVKKGIPYPLGAFENRRSFCSIDNLSFVINQIMIQNVPNGIYNVCDDETLSTKELIALMSVALEKKAYIWNWNKNFIEFIASLGSIIKFPLNTERLKKLTENYIVTNNKIKNALNLTSMPLSASEGILKTLKSLK